MWCRCRSDLGDTEDSASLWQVYGSHARLRVPMEPQDDSAIKKNPFLYVDNWIVFFRTNTELALGKFLLVRSVDKRVRVRVALG